MRKGNPSPYQVRLRVERIEERTNATKMPPLDKLYRSAPGGGADFLKLLVENMTFSEYPGAKLGNASSLSSFLMNGNNISELRSSGCLGAILEILRRIDVEQNPESEDVTNLVSSLHIISKGDQNVQRRLVNHPNGLSAILRLCKHTHGRLQEMSFDILEWLGRLEADSQQKLLDRNIIKTLLKPAFMYRASTLHSVRKRAAQMIRTLCMGVPERMRIYDFAEICVSPGGSRLIDGDMEVWLLSSTVNYLNWFTKINHDSIFLGKVFKLLSHLLEEILSESFESIEHMLLILRCCTMVSRDPKHIRYMLDNGLGPALQYLVRTDFNLFRPKVKGKQAGGGGGDDREALREMAAKFKTKKLSVLDSGERSSSTLLFLKMLKPDLSKNSGAKHDDINLTVTKYVCNLYENIFTNDTIVIAELVGSGLVPALVFRVGKGRDRDLRFNKFVIHFLHQLFLQVTLAQPHRGNTMSQFKSSVDGGGFGAKRGWFCPRGGEGGGAVDAVAALTAPTAAPTTAATTTTTTTTTMEEGADTVAAIHTRRMKEQSTDLDIVSNTLYAHGVAELLFATLRSPMLEDPLVVRECITTLAMMRYGVYNDTAILEENRDALFLIYRTRSDCLYQFLFILCEMIQCTDARIEVLDDLVTKLKAMRTLVRALTASGWIFHDKDFVYRCFGKLAVLIHFVQSLREVEGGISVVCREVALRKAKMRQNRRTGTDDDDGTEKLQHVLREDLAAVRIQSISRMRAAYRRISVLLGKRDPGSTTKKIGSRRINKAK